jgi:hypothetical protein
MPNAVTFGEDIRPLFRFVSILLTDFSQCAAGYILGEALASWQESCLQEVVAKIPGNNPLILRTAQENHIRDGRRKERSTLIYEDRLSN